MSKGSTQYAGLAVCFLPRCAQYRLGLSGRRAHIAIKMSINVHRCLALLSSVLLVFFSVVRAMDDMAQDVLKGPVTTTFQGSEPWEWRVELSRDWDV